MNTSEFVKSIVKEARLAGYRIETSREGLEQIDFGNKKLNSKHLSQIFPLLRHGKSIPEAINQAAPGRPCSHKPMRDLISKLDLDN